MAVKDVKQYYDSVCEDYAEMLNSLHDMEEEAQKGLISPDRVEQIKDMIKPIKDNYMRISYIMFLLNKPTKFDKFLGKLGIKTSRTQLSERVDSSATLEAVREEDKEAIEAMTLK